MIFASSLKSELCRNVHRSATMSRYQFNGSSHVRPKLCRRYLFRLWEELAFLGEAAQSYNVDHFPTFAKFR